MKYNTSKDYSLLYDLIQKMSNEDFVIGMINYKSYNGKPCRDVCKFRKNGNYVLASSRGMFYFELDKEEQTRENFIAACEFSEVEWLPPVA